VHEEGTFVQSVHGKGKVLKIFLETRVLRPNCQKGMVEKMAEKYFRFWETRLSVRLAAFEFL
jgi:hypothetical protein